MQRLQGRVSLHVLRASWQWLHYQNIELSGQCVSLSRLRTGAADSIAHATAGGTDRGPDPPSRTPARDITKVIRLRAVACRSSCRTGPREDGTCRHNGCGAFRGRQGEPGNREGLGLTKALSHACRMILYQPQSTDEDKYNNMPRYSDNGTRMYRSSCGATERKIDSLEDDIVDGDITRRWARDNDEGIPV